MISGLLGKTTSPKFSIEVLPNKGRGIILQEAVPEGSYVLEYKAEVYPRKERAAHESEYIANDEGCYILDIQTKEGWMCLDATRYLSSPGRLLNHAPSAQATLKPFRPLLLKGKWRVGFTSTRDLHPGEELTWNYGCAPNGIEWLGQRPKTQQSESSKYLKKMLLSTTFMYKSLARID